MARWYAHHEWASALKSLTVLTIPARPPEAATGREADAAAALAGGAAAAAATCARRGLRNEPARENERLSAIRACVITIDEEATRTGQKRASQQQRDHRRRLPGRRRERARPAAILSVNEREMVEHAHMYSQYTTVKLTLSRSGAVKLHCPDPRRLGGSQLWYQSSSCNHLHL